MAYFSSAVSGAAVEVSVSSAVWIWLKNDYKHDRKLTLINSMEECNSISHCFQYTYIDKNYYKHECKLTVTIIKPNYILKHINFMINLIL